MAMCSINCPIETPPRILGQIQPQKYSIEMSGQIVRKTFVFICVILMILKEHPSKGLGAQGKFLKIVNEPASSAGANEKILQLN